MRFYTFESLKPSKLKRAFFPMIKQRSKKNILRVASFEMVLDVKQLKGHNITSREKMGVAGNIINLEKNPF